MVESVENTPYGREMIIEAVWLKDQVPVVRKVDNAIHRLNNPGQEKSNPITLFTLLTLSKTKAGAMAKLSSSVTYH